MTGVWKSVVRRLKGFSAELAVTPPEMRGDAGTSPSSHDASDRRLVDGREPVDFGDLRRSTPISVEFGFDRGKPLDRRYIEAFLQKNAADIQGRVLEFGDNTYTKRFGAERVSVSDVFNRSPEVPQTTFFGDLSDGSALPSDTFDGIILTQTLQYIFDTTAAVTTLWRSLRPGGVLLVTVPWVSPMDRDQWLGNWYWSIAPAALRRLLAAQFGADQVAIESYGNVLVATAFLHGLAEHELTQTELDATDSFCPVIVAGRAQKAGPDWCAAS